MKKFLLGLSNDYMIYVILSVVVIIAIIGYVVDSKKNKIDKNVKDAPIQTDESEEKQVL